MCRCLLAHAATRFLIWKRLRRNDALLRSGLTRRLLLGVIQVIVGRPCDHRALLVSETTLYRFGLAKY
jgi:hypothetical protein